MKKKKKKLVHLHQIGLGLNILTTFFFGTTKINGVLNAINQGVCVMHLEMDEC